MAISFEAALGIHDKALAFRSQRAEVLANNIANADTPGYQARDLDFRQVLAQATGNGDINLKRTNGRHLANANTAGMGAELQYRVPMQPSIDGNTVDLQIEQAEYTENAIDFQASFTFLNSKLSGLMRAIKGE
ncbi:MAG: flagellar basal body rod protein FlgB [Pseudomonadales bacterium]|jgi:flagellar basal-body rod protein FlgB